MRFYTTFAPSVAAVFASIAFLGTPYAAGRDTSAAADGVAREYGQALKAVDVCGRLSNLGAETNGETGAAFTRMVRDDVARWARIVRASNVKVE